MPFCSQCGNQVTTADLYCGRCGVRQPPAGGPPPTGGPAPPHDPLAGMTPRTASILCYVPGIGWIASIIILASNRFRFDRAVRFHGFQGLYLFLAWLADDLVLRPLFHRIPDFHLYSLVQALLLGMSIFMMVKASHGESYMLPIFGELAHKSAAEE